MAFFFVETNRQIASSVYLSRRIYRGALTVYCREKQSLMFKKKTCLISVYFNEKQTGAY